MTNMMKASQISKRSHNSQSKFSDNQMNLHRWHFTFFFFFFMLNLGFELMHTHSHTHVPCPIWSFTFILYSQHSQCFFFITKFTLFINAINHIVVIFQICSVGEMTNMFHIGICSNGNRKYCNVRQVII